MPPLDVVILYNEPVLSPDHPDWASESGVLEAVESVAAALAEASHRVTRVAVGATATQLLQRLEACGSIDVIFNLCEGLGGTGAGEANVAGLLELGGWAHTGAAGECLSLVRDKARTKWLLAGGGLPTAAFHLLTPRDPLPEETLQAALALGPWIVKPAREDASLGIGPDSVVTTLEALRRQVAKVRDQYGDVLVEQFIAGREFNVGIVALPEPRVLPLSEIEFDPAAGAGWKIVTYEAKWTPDSADFSGTPVRCPAQVEPALAAELNRVALAAFRLTHCRDYARVDMRVDAQGRIFILEVNANPDISPSAGFARALQVSGTTHPEFVNRLTEYVAASRRGSLKGVSPRQ